MSKKTWFYLLVFLQAFFLIGMSSSYYAMDAFGQSIKLKTVPVDPGDPFYGDYMALTYEIETIPADKWKGNREVNRGQRVFLLLEMGENGIYNLREASPLWMKAGKNQVVLKAKMEGYQSYSQIYEVNIGLGRYFIEENTGDLFAQGDQRIVEVVLAPWGQKKIKSLNTAP